MSFLDNLTAKIPFLRRQEQKEYFFALNIGLEKIKSCVWTIESGNLKILNIQVGDYSSLDEILEVTDRLLDKALGSLLPEPEKILFGVPDSFLVDDELKEPNLKLLQEISKSLELAPMAYVATSHAISHLLDKTEGGPTTAILIDIGKEHLSASIFRAGKIDGTKIVSRSDNLGTDVEKALLGFTDIEVLPSKILIYSSSFENLDKQKETLMGFSWMNKLPFLHIPKIDVLDKACDIAGVSLAGAVEINPDVKYIPEIVQSIDKDVALAENIVGIPVKSEEETGFVTGDIEESENQIKSEVGELADQNEDIGLQNTTDTSVSSDISERMTALPEGEEESNLALASEQRKDLEEPLGDSEVSSPSISSKLNFLKFPSWIKIPNNLKRTRLFIPILVVLVLVAAYLLLPQAKVSIFVEPKVLEKDAQVIADPSIKQVMEDQKKIPGQVVETQVTGSDKANASGTKQIGDPAKGVVTIRNKTDKDKNFSQGTVLVASSSGGLKFTLDKSVTVPAQSPDDGTWGSKDVDVVSSQVGADGNLPSDTKFTVSGFSVSDYDGKASGNFSGGTSKEVKVVTDEDQKKLLATLAANLRKQAQQQLQGKLKNDQKILEEALTEKIIQKTYNKNINDQASDFSLNLTINYKGIAYSDADLKSIVAKLVDTNIPEGYQLDLNDTETEADVSKMENNQLIFLARFKAKLSPKFDLEKIKQEIKGQTPAKAGDILRGYENVLESDIQMIPAMPTFLARLPLLPQRIQIEVKLK